MIDLSNIIDAADLPLTSGGAFDSVIGVDQATRKLRRFPKPVSGTPEAYATVADLPTTETEGTPAYVNNDPTPENNGLWAYLGGEWVKSNDRVNGVEVRVTQAEADVSDLQSRTSQVESDIGDLGVQAEALSARMKLGRAVVSGDATVVGKTSSRFLVTTRQGSLYLEGAGAGARSAVIAAVTTPVEIQPHYGLVVDFANGPVDGSGAYVPQYLAIGSAGASGWQSASRYILVGRDFSGALFGEYAINNAMGPFDGEACAATVASAGLPTWDQATRTLTWPQLILATRTGAGGDPAVAPRILLNAGSVTVPDAQLAIVYLNLSQVVQAGTPPTAVVAMDYINGPRMEPAGYLPLFSVGRSFAYPIRFPPTVGSSSLPVTAAAASSNDLVVTADTADLLHVHIPLVGQPGSYMRWSMRHLAGSTARGMPYDVWQISGGALAALSGSSSAVVADILDTGQAEYAIRKPADLGFDIGGQAHGNDMMTDVVFFADGAPVDVASIVGAPVACRRFEAIQHSDVFDTDTVTPLANRVCRWIFEGADLILNNRLEFVAPLGTLIHYAPMASTHRIVEGEQVTDRAMRAPLWALEDVSGEHARVNTNGSEVKVWGEETGLSVEVKILEGWKGESQVHLSSDLDRNKVYFEVDGPAPSYAAGDVSSYTARLRISHR